MAGRHSDSIKLREIPLPRGAHPIDDPRRLHDRLVSNITTVRSHHHSTILQDRIAIQHREIESLLVDNRRLAVAQAPLKEELSLVQQELLHLLAAAADIKAERDDQVRHLYERSLKLDAEVRSIDAMSEELVAVRSDMQKLAVHLQQQRADLQAINGDLEQAKKDARQVPEIKADIETVQQEIQKGRAAIEYEKKTCVTNLEQGKIMEKNRVILVREIEKLHAELANAEKRARAAAAAAAAANPSPGFAANYGNPDMGYGGSPYPDPYSLHQVQGVSDTGPPFVSGAVPSCPYDVPQTQAEK